MKGFLKMDKNKFSIIIKYKDGTTSWNNLSTQIVSFLIDNEELKNILCSERGSVNGD